MPFTAWNPYYWKRLRLRGAPKTCTKANDVVVKKGQAGKMLKAVQPVCETADVSIDYYKDHEEMLDYAMMRIEDIVRTMAGFSVGLRQLGMLLPTALSIAPGLVKGAMLIKLLVPKSTIPVILILILPWVYTPLLWCSCFGVFQAVGDPFLLVGLLGLPVAPLSYNLVGFHYHIDKSAGDAGLPAIDRTGVHDCGRGLPLDLRCRGPHALPALENHQEQQRLAQAILAAGHRRQRGRFSESDGFEHAAEAFQERMGGPVEMQQILRKTGKSVGSEGTSSS